MNHFKFQHTVKFNVLQHLSVCMLQMWYMQECFSKFVVSPLWCDWLRPVVSLKHRLHGFRWAEKNTYKWTRGPMNKWRFQIPSAKLVTEANIPSPAVLARAFLTWQSLETMAKREQSRHSSAVTLSPPLQSFSLSGVPLHTMPRPSWLLPSELHQGN